MFIAFVLEVLPFVPLTVRHYHQGHPSVAEESSRWTVKPRDTQRMRPTRRIYARIRCVFLEVRQLGVFFRYMRANLVDTDVWTYMRCLEPNGTMFSAIAHRFRGSTR